MEESSVELQALVARSGERASSRATFLDAFATELLKVETNWKPGLQPVPIELLATRLGVPVRTGQPRFGEGALIKKGLETEILVSDDQLHEWSAAPVLSERGRFTVAHEISHHLLSLLQDRFGDSKDCDVYGLLDLSPRKTERVCDELASHLLAPACLFSDERMMSLIAGKLGSIGEVGRVAGIEFIRRRLGISRWVLVGRLGRSALLNRAESGVIISMIGPNRATGREPAPRVVTAGLPTWGDIPWNIRLSSIGLWSATRVFAHGMDGQVVRWEEEVRVKEVAGPGSSAPRWKDRLICLSGEHALYRYGGRRRYLLTTLNWPAPTATRGE